MSVQLFITGGTLDKAYNQQSGELVFTKTHLRDILRQAKCTVEVDLQVIMLKDSLYMTQEDRQSILESCQNSLSQRIIITHGTDTMTETAKLLGSQITHKVVVLLGAMVPYTFSNSDALFNLGCAFSAVQLLPKGVYVTMNGNIFPYYAVEKNKEQGEFFGKSLCFENLCDARLCK